MYRKKNNWRLTSNQIRATTQVRIINKLSKCWWNQIILLLILLMLTINIILRHPAAHDYSNTDSATGGTLQTENSSSEYATEFCQLSLSAVLWLFCTLEYPQTSTILMSMSLLVFILEMVIQEKLPCLSQYQRCNQLHLWLVSCGSAVAGTLILSHPNKAWEFWKIALST